MLFWIGAKANLFAITFISILLKTLLKSKTESEEKYPWMRFLTLIFSGISICCKSSSMESNSSSCKESQINFFYLATELELFETSADLA